MTIGNIIEKHFDEFKGLVRNPDILIENANTYEDIFQSAIYTTLKKYGKGEVENEEEAYNYTRKTILSEFLFCKKRIKNNFVHVPESYMDNIIDSDE